MAEHGQDVRPSLEDPLPGLADALTGVVYFAWSDERKSIKIGYTMNLVERMRKLRCVPLVTVTGGPDLERYLHGYFADQRLDGEWFALSGGLLEYLAVTKEHQIGTQRVWLD